MCEDTMKVSVARDIILNIIIAAGSKLREIA